LKLAAPIGANSIFATLIHFAFLLSAMAIAYTDRIVMSTHNDKHS